MSAHNRGEGDPHLEVYREQNIHVFLAHNKGKDLLTQAQEHNMPALDAILEKNIRLIDYEKITD